MEAVLAWDARLLLWLNGWIGASPVLDSLLWLVVSDYLTPVVLSLCLVGMWFGARARREWHQRAVLVSLSGMGFASLAVLVFNHLFFRPRPFLVHPEVFLFFYRPTDPSSFPSHAATVGFALAAGVGYGNPRLGAWAYLMAALWSLARVAVGVAYPSDVLVGAALGVGITYLVVAGFRLLEPVPTLVLRAAQRLYLA